MTKEQAMESLRLKFSSLNSVPVSQAVISRDEYEAIKAIFGVEEPEYSTLPYLADD